MTSSCGACRLNFGATERAISMGRPAKHAGTWGDAWALAEIERIGTHWNTHSLGPVALMSRTPVAGINSDPVRGMCR